MIDSDKKYIAYYRVSTQKQGQSGLGLEAQRQTVINYLGNKKIIAEYTEIESGKNNERMELKKAIKNAKIDNAILVIAKLDRLSRNAGFVMQLRDSNVEFVCCDIPDANTLTIGIFALIAQQEREMISERTKKALEAKKKQGYKLGKPENLTDKARYKAKQIKEKNAKEDINNKKAFALINELRKQNISYKKIADRLNEYGFITRKGKQFYPMTIKQIENIYM